MDADWVKVFHITYDQRIVCTIPHDFVFDFLKACYGALDQTLSNWREFEAVFCDFLQLFLIATDTAASSPV